MMDKHPQPDEFKTKLFWVSIFIGVLIGGGLTLVGIYGLQKYGVALFIAVPFLLGFIPPIWYAGSANLSWNQSVKLGLVALFMYSFFLMIFAIEGLICIAMVIPIAIVINIIGSFLSYHLMRFTKKNKSAAILLAMLVFPALSFMEKDMKPSLSKVVTSVEISAPKEVVWQNVVTFSEIEPPKEFLFKMGIAYPTDAVIDGTGVGAVRHCNFTTGSFVEPITTWDEPNLLQFDVLEQPAPLREISFWDINAPHLHDYFISLKGQFKLSTLPNGNTLLEGSTWYYHDIRPEFYWRFYSDYIIHKIHYRVLNHIKKQSEKII